MEPARTHETENQGTQTIDDAARQAQAAALQQPQIIFANPPVRYAVVQPQAAVYQQPQVIFANPQVQYIQAANPVYVVPNNSRQVMYANDVVVDIVPTQKAKLVIGDQTPPLNTFCTSRAPQLFYCTVCKKELVSRVKYKYDKGFLCCWIFLFIICFPWSLLFLCCWPLGYKEAIHKCPECRREVGRVPMLF